MGLFPLAIPVGFVLVGTQAGRLLDVRTMKQYFARIVAGFSLGFVVGGLATTALIGPLGGPVDLLLVDVVAGAAYLWTAVATGRRFPAELGRRPQPEPLTSTVPTAEGPAPRRQGLFVMIFGYQLLAAAVTQLLDFVVWERAAFHFPDPSDLARFQGLFGTLINVVALLFVFLVAGRLLVRYGERGGLTANPLGLVVLLLVGTVVGVTAGAAGTAFFVVVCAQQVAHIALIDGMTRAAINTSYQALDPPTRLRAQTVVEAAGVPLAVGFVGALLLVFRFTELGVRVVVAVTLVLTMAWLVVALLAYRRYREGVLALVTARPWEPLDLLDSDNDVVMGLLASPDARDVMVGLSAVNGRRRLPAAEVAGLMTSSDPYARLAAVCELIEAGGESAPEAQELWVAALADRDPEVHQAALSGCAAAPDPFFVPHLLDAIITSPPSAALADALERHAADLAPVAAVRLAHEPPGLSRERLTWALGVMRDSLPAAPVGLPDMRAEVASRAFRVTRGQGRDGRVQRGPRPRDPAPGPRRGRRALSARAGRAPRHAPRSPPRRPHRRGPRRARTAPACPGDRAPRGAGRSRDRGAHRGVARPASGSRRPHGRAQGVPRSRAVGGRVGHRPGRGPRGALGRLVVEGLRDPCGTRRARRVGD